MRAPTSTTPRGWQCAPSSYAYAGSPFGGPAAHRSTHTRFTVPSRLAAPQSLCDDPACPYSHRVDPDKMPVCVHFLQGVCAREPCPYSHVRVAPDAPVCDDFVAGFCPRGLACPRLHTLVCPEFSATGRCAKGKRCRLKHPAKPRQGSPAGRAAPAALPPPRRSPRLATTGGKPALALTTTPASLRRRRPSSTLSPAAVSSAASPADMIPLVDSPRGAEGQESPGTPTTPTVSEALVRSPPADGGEAMYIRPRFLRGL